jgi:excisionase family DNA binding protein
MNRTLSPRQLAHALDVSESSLKRWVDEGLITATRTAGGHRRIPVSEAIRFIRESDAVITRPEILGLPEINQAPADLTPDDESACLAACLADGRAAEARGLIMSLYLDGRSVADICDGPLRLAMTHIGELWMHGDEGIFIEHRATDICIESLNQIRMTLPQPTASAPVAVGGASSGDPYLLPSLAAATVLAAEGFNAVNLGPDTPPNALLAAADAHQASLLWLSASSTEHAADLRDQVQTLLAALARNNRSLVIGGRALNTIKLPLTDHAHTTRSLAELVSFAKGLALARSA